MKRFMAVVLVLALLVGLLPTLTVTAAPVADLTALAAYYPATTPIFMSLRTDEGYVETLDGLFNILGSRLPEGSIAPAPVASALDQFVTESELGADFETAIRPWLGGFAALGVLSLETQFDDDHSNDDDTPMLIMAAITDRAAAEAFWDAAIAEGIADGSAEIRKTADYTAYLPTGEDDENSGVLITADRLVVAFKAMDVALGEVGASLAEDARFQHAMAALPAPDYHIALYVTAEAVIASQQFNTMSLSEAEIEAVLATGQDSAVAVGLTVLDNLALTIDGALALGPQALAKMAENNLALPPATQIDRNFAAFLPANAQLMIQGTDLAASYAGLIENLGTVAAVEGNAEDMQQGLQFLGFAIKSALNLDLKQDILSWMTGDYAAYLSFDRPFIDGLFDSATSENPPSTIAIETWPFDFGLLVEVTDPAASQKVIAALSDALPRLLTDQEEAQATVSLEEIGAGQAVVVTFAVPPAEDMSLPESFEILIGANDQVFALGTRAAVTAALDPGDGLPANAEFDAAGSLLLENAIQIGYVAPDGVMSFGDLFFGLALTGPQVGDVFENIVTELEAQATLTPEQIEQREQARLEAQQRMMAEARQARAQATTALEAIQNLTYSVAYADDSTLVGRATLTLAPAAR